jgi:hypothetical protein
LSKVLKLSISRLDATASEQLRSQYSVLMEIGRIIEARDLFNEFFNTRVFSETKNIYDYPGFDLVADRFMGEIEARQSISVKGFILPVKMFTAIKLTSELAVYNQNGDFNQAILDIGLAYGALEPQGEPSKRFFIHSLWRSVSEGGFRQGGQELNTFLSEIIELAQPWIPGIGQPWVKVHFATSVLRLIANLLKAIRRIPALETQSHDAEFLRRVVELGASYMTFAPWGENDNEQWLNFCLNTLNTPVSENELGKGAWELGYLLAANDKPEQVLELSINLLKAAQRAGLGEERQDPKFLAALVGSGRDYIVLNPGATSDLGVDAPTSFINTLWLEPSASGVRQAARELRSNFTVIPSVLRTKALRFGRRLLKTMQNYSNLPDENPTFLAELLEVGRLYTVLNPWLPGDFEDNPLNSFLSTMWKAKYEDEITLGQDEFGSFFSKFLDFDPQMQLVKLSRNLLQAAYRSSRAELRVEKHNAWFLTRLVELGREYAEMEPGGASLESAETPSKFFLDTFWNATTVADGRKGREEFDAFFKDIRKPSQTVQLERNLLEAARQSLGTEQYQDAALLRELLGLGRVYATLNPIDLLTPPDSEPNFFLNTLWTAKDIDAAGLGCYEFSFFLSDFKPEHLVRLFALERTFLSAAKTSTDLRRSLRDPRVVRELMGLGALYTALYGEADEPEDSGMFLDMLWHHQDRSLAIASTEFSRMVSDIKGDRLNREAIFLGIRLLLVARNMSELDPDLGASQPRLRLLLQPLAHVASAYTALNPTKNSSVSFVQSAWWATNGIMHKDLILQGSEQLREFLAGTVEHPRFKTNEQPQVVDFVAKLLKAAKLTTKLSGRQKRDPRILTSAFIDAARDAAKFQLSYPHRSGDDLTFWDRFWMADVDDQGAIQRGITELDQYLTELGLPIETMGYLGKLWFALGLLGEKLGSGAQEIIRDIRENLGMILLFCGFIGILMLIPVVGEITIWVLAIIDLIFSVASGIESIQAFSDFLIQVWQAEDEAGLEIAAESLARAIFAGIGAVIGLAGFFKSLKLLKQSAIVIKAFLLNVINLARRSVRQFRILADFLIKFWKVEGVVKDVLITFFNLELFGRLMQLLEYLHKFPRVFDLLLKVNPRWSLRLLKYLKSSLNDAKLMIDELSNLMTRGDVNEETIVRHLNQEGSTIKKIKLLLTALPPNPSRHTASRASSFKVASVNTIIDPSVDIQADVAAIRGGFARWDGESLLVNGRVYKIHSNGRLYPISGTGFYQLNANQYRAFSAYNQYNGDIATANRYLDRRISVQDREEALRVWRLTH